MTSPKYIDIFNGDADGIFSLIQWRKSYPVKGENQHLVTGVKRDVSLVQHVDAKLAKDAIMTVLDVSFDKNVEATRNVLEHCKSLFYCDHHQADALFEHQKLRAYINTEPTVCTALLINEQLKGVHCLWAVAAAYGDGLDSVGDCYASKLGLNDGECLKLKEFGVLVNYNGYGSTVKDLHFDPSMLYATLLSYDSPFAVMADKQSPFYVLQAKYAEDIARANKAQRECIEQVVVVILEDAMWARRISGTLGNQLAKNNPQKAVVIVTHNSQDSYTVSLRAPRNKPYAASTVCSLFATGGGREGAAGVNDLPKNELDRFITLVQAQYAKMP